MKRLIALKKVISWVAMAGLIGMASCKKGDDNVDPVNTDNDYLLVSRTLNSDGMYTAFYGQFVEDLLNSTTASIDNSKAVEINPAAGAGMVAYKNSFYFNNYSAFTLEKWDRNTAGILAKTASMDFTDMGYAGNITFKDENVAFVGGSNLPKVAIFNPTTAKRTGFIDLSKLSRVGETTDFPTPGNKIMAETAAEMIIRDNFMFIAMYYVSDFQSWTPCTATCEIIVVDLSKVDPNSADNSAAVVKRISDNRGSYTGAWNSGGGSYFMTLDEKGDIYMQCHNMWMGHRETVGHPACVLRIKNGATEFDKDYFFDLEKASSGSSVMGLEYTKNGKFFAAVIDWSAVDPNNPYSYYMDPIHHWWQFDLYNQTAKIVTTELTKGSSSTLMYKEGDYAYIPFATKTESYVLRVNSNTLEQKKMFATNGDPFIFKLKK